MLQGSHEACGSVPLFLSMRDACSNQCSPVPTNHAMHLPQLASNWARKEIPMTRATTLTQMTVRLQSLTVLGRDEILTPLAFPTDALA
jgi:hypothetical protein